MMEKYLGITIGPIIKTLMMAKKPRELWSASYLFSGLMEALINEFMQKSIPIISPGIVSNNQSGVGLYPDRLFCKNENYSFSIIVDIINEIKKKYSSDINVNKEYFRTYAVEIEADSDGVAIEQLNHKLDVLELFQTAIPDDIEQSIRKLIIKKDDSDLFEMGFGDRKKTIPTLAEIGSTQLKQLDSEKYSVCLKDAEKEEKESGKDTLISKLRESFGEQFKTPHKYICIVHADGDNMGAIINLLDSVNIKLLSDGLLDFGQKACQLVKDFQGLPIYAGGDDLLFIAPVISNDSKGKEHTIFDLIEQLSQQFYNTIDSSFVVFDPNNIELKPSMSFGLTITYYKFPLYEAMEMSRNKLFVDAKEYKTAQSGDQKIKNCVAWRFQKGSGSSVDGIFSYKEDGLVKAFNNLQESVDNQINSNMVSAVTHKIKSNETLLKIIFEDQHSEERLKAFFDTFLDYNNKKGSEKKYLDGVKILLKELFKSSNDVKKVVKNAYSILRTIKFIKGLEEDKDE